MLFYLYKTWIKKILKSPNIIFWSLLFPCLLITLFNSSLKGLDEDFKFKLLKLDYIEDEQTKTYLSGAIEIMLNDSSFKESFLVSKFNDEKISKDRLSNKKIDGYFYLTSSDTDPNKTDLILVCTEDQLSKSIIISTFENFKTMSNVTYNIISENGTITDDYDVHDYFKQSEKISSLKTPSIVGLYTFPAIVYSILQGASVVVGFMYLIKTNLSDLGGRINTSPVKKWQLIVSVLLAIATFQFIFAILTTFYASNILNINIGIDNNFLMLLILYVVSIFTTISLTIMITMVAPKNEKLCENIVTAFMLFIYFLSGGMLESMPSTIKTYLPVLHYINPASLISDSLVQLAYKEDLTVFLNNLILIAGLGIIYLSVSILILSTRRD